jgi:hypothetical protein
MHIVFTASPVKSRSITPYHQRNRYDTPTLRVDFLVRCSQINCRYLTDAFKMTKILKASEIIKALPVRVTAAQHISWIKDEQR